MVDRPNVRTAIFSDTVNVISVEFYMISLSLSVNLSMFQGHSSVKQFTKKLRSDPIKLELCRLGMFVK